MSRGGDAQTNRRELEMRKFKATKKAMTVFASLLRQARLAVANLGREICDEWGVTTCFDTYDARNVCEYTVSCACVICGEAMDRLHADYQSWNISEDDYRDEMCALEITLRTMDKVRTGEVRLY